MRFLSVDLAVVDDLDLLSLVWSDLACRTCGWLLNFGPLMPVLWADTLSKGMALPPLLCSGPAPWDGFHAILLSVLGLRCSGAALPA